MARHDYTQTDDAIRSAYLDLLKQKKKMPTQEEVAERCNITRKTVNLHLNKIKLPNIHKPYKIFGDKVLLALYAKALKGDVLAIKLFLSLIYDWNEKQEVKGELKVKAEVKVMSMEDTIEKYKKVLDKISEE